MSAACRQCDIASRLVQLLVDAKKAGVVVTVSLRSIQPFASGRYVMVPEVRPARVMAETGSAP